MHARRVCKTRRSQRRKRQQALELRFALGVVGKSKECCAVAGKLPSITWPSAAFVSALYLVRRPNGVPCAVDTK